ncbi:MAG: PRC-barrel domain-containing protein [Pirellulales bacterium]
MKSRLTVMAAAIMVGAASIPLAEVYSQSDNRTTQAGSTSNATTTTGQSDVANQNQASNAADSKGLGKLDSQTSGANIRASQLIGANLENSNGDGVGEIKDLVIDGNTGQIRYAAVTYGGFLGVGSKLFAVPFEAFKVRQQKGDADDYVLTLNVTKDQLEGAQGFDTDHWPNFADPKFTSELDRRYGVDRSALRSQDRSSHAAGTAENRNGTANPDRR